MPAFIPKPLIGIPTSTQSHEEYRTPQHTAGEKYIRAVAGCAKAVPVLIPALGDDHDWASLLASLDGVMLTGGRANIEPHHYGGPPFPDDEVRDPRRDATVLPLIRACIDEGVPVFGVCRGIQEINVALGGSLHYRVHLLPDKMDHRIRRDGSVEERFGPRHAVAMRRGGWLARLAGAEQAVVNSAHGQAIDRLGAGLEVEALAPDGIVEAVRATHAKTFTVGVQWHAEWGIESHALSRALFEAFGDAARRRAACRAPRAAVRA